jgi:hypothetical protein
MTKTEVVFMATGKSPAVSNYPGCGQRLVADVDCRGHGTAGLLVDCLAAERIHFKLVLQNLTQLGRIEGLGLLVDADKDDVGSRT